MCQGQELVCPVDDDDEPRDNEDASLKSSWISTTFDAKDVCSFRNMPSKASAVRELLLSMPRNLNKDKEDNKKELSVQQQLQLQRLDIVEEADDEEDVADEKLEIAWQYR